MVEGTALRRLPATAARAARRGRRGATLALGLALAVIAIVPLLGLLVPVLGTAAAVHLLQRRADITACAG
jgi:uncharacterized protein involved in cysteine biosynthesis